MCHLEKKLFVKKNQTLITLCCEISYLAELDESQKKGKREVEFSFIGGASGGA